jgi:hypothetical protein
LAYSALASLATSGPWATRWLRQTRWGRRLPRETRESIDQCPRTFASGMAISLTVILMHNCISIRIRSVLRDHLSVSSFLSLLIYQVMGQYIYRCLLLNRMYKLYGQFSSFQLFLCFRPKTWPTWPPSSFSELFCFYSLYAQNAQTHWVFSVIFAFSLYDLARTSCRGSK